MPDTGMSNLSKNVRVEIINEEFPKVAHFTVSSTYILYQ